MSRRALAALLSINATIATAAPLMTWEQLREHCSSPQAPQHALCEGYVLGAADAGQLCIPDSIKPATLQDLALSINADNAASPARSIAERLQAVFPCAGDEGQAEADNDERDTEAASSERSPNWSNKARIGK